MSLTTIKTAIANLLNDPTYRFWTEAFLLEVINVAQRQISTTLNASSTYEVANSLASGQYYDLPPSYFVPMGVEYRDSASNPYKPLQLIDIHDLQAISSGNPTRTGTPQYYFIVNTGLNSAETGIDKIGLYPVPDTAVSGGIKIWIWKLPSDFTTGASTSSLPKYLQDLIVYYSCMMAYLKRKDQVMADHFKDLYNGTLLPYFTKINPSVSHIKDEDYYPWV